VLDDIRRQFPEVAAHHYWAARTDFLVWVLPRWAESGKWAGFAHYAALAFLANPLWWLNKKARRSASTPAKMLVRRLLPRPPQPGAPMRPAREFGLLAGALEDPPAGGAA
jgi:hypothetical protein